MKMRMIQNMLSFIDKSHVFCALLIGTNIVFVFLHIYKRSTFIALSYEEQRLTQEQAQIQLQLKQLKQEYSALTSHATIKKQSADTAMYPIQLAQISKISHHE